MKRARNAFLVAYVMALLSFAISIAVFYPGLVTYDSIDQYRQALEGTYNDIHPPMMAAIWRKLLAIDQGPSGFLFFNLLIYWLSFCLLAIFCIRRSGRMIGSCAVLAGFFPFLLAFSGVIWKDVVFAALWALGSVLLLLCSLPSRPQRTIWAFWGIAVFAILLGATMRHNAWPAGLPLMVAAALQAPVPSKRWRTLLGIALCSLVVIAPPVTARALQAERGDSFQYVASWDLVGISYFAGRNYLAADGHKAANPDLRCYSPRLFDACPMLHFASRDEARTRWVSAIAAEPVAYLEHRTLVFAMLLRVGCERCAPFVWVTQSDANPYGLRFEGNILHRGLGLVVRALATTPLGRPYVWVIALAGMAALLWRHGRSPSDRILMLIATSGTLYAGTYFVAAVTDEFRYLYWSIFSAVLVGTAMLVGMSDATRLRQMMLWVLLPVLVAIGAETTLRGLAPIDNIAPSMTTNY